MPGMSAIQVKDVPEELHEALRQRAAERGVPLGQYVLELIRRDLQRPRLEAWAEQVRANQRAAEGGAASVRWSATEAVRAAREERDAELDERIAAWRR